MAEIILLLSVAIGALLAMNIGVNTLGSTVGILRGSTNQDYKVVAGAAVLAALAGTFLLSERIVSTISRDLIKLEPSGIFAVLLAIIIIAGYLNYKGTPISSTYVVIGAIMGYGFFAGGLGFAKLQQILIIIFASPFVALIAGFALNYFIKRTMKNKMKGISKIESFEMMFIIPSLVGMLLLSFALGANSVGIAMGLFGNELSFSTLFLIGAVGIIAGILLFGKKTTQTIGIELADLSPSRGFIVMLVTGIIMLAFVYSGIPISATQTIMGALIGVSLATRAVNLKEAAKISASWLILLPAAIVILSGLLAGGIALIL